MFFGKENKDLLAFLRGAFYVFIALFPFILYEGYLFNGTSTRAINTVVFIEALALVIGLAALGKQGRLTVVKSPITTALVLFLVTLFVASFMGVDLATSFWSKATRTTGLFYFSHMALWYLFFWTAFREEKPMRTFVKVFILSAGLFSILSVFGQEGTKTLFGGKPWSGLMIGNSTFAGMYLYAAFMLSIYFIWTQEKAKWWKKLLPLVFVVNPYIINFDLWRGLVQTPIGAIGSAQASALTMLFSVFVLLVFWVVSRMKSAATRRTILFVGMGVSVVVFALGVHSLLTPNGKAQQLYLQQSSAVRPIVWQATKEAIAERPLFGWGVDNFDRVFQQYYDNRILEEENGGEAWLDRAHNIFVDQTIESGYVGTAAYLLVYIALFYGLFYVIVRSKNRHDVVFATVLSVYFAGHLLELQTAFDTTITYLLLASFAVMAGILFARTRATEGKKDGAVELPLWGQRIIAGVIVVFGVGMFSAGAVPIMNVEAANGAIRRVGSSEKRLLFYPTLLSSPLDNGEFLWRTSNDIQRGVSIDPEIVEDPKQREALKGEIGIIVTAYETYLATNGHDYRAMLNLADMYLYQRFFEVNNLAKAHVLLDQAILLVPQSPQPYWMKAVTFLYQAKFKEAREWAAKAHAINPNIEETKRLVEYIETAIKEFPVIDLYSFRKI